MDPSPAPVRRSLVRLPRPRGDGPVTGASAALAGPAPPPARGWTYSGGTTVSSMTAPPPARGWTFFKNYRAGIMVLAHPPLAIHACLGYTKQNGQRIETPSLRQLHARVSSKEQ